MIDAVVFYRWDQQRGVRQFDRAIRQAARRYGIDPALVKAVMWRESGFNPKARGQAGEIGLMQIRQLAAEEWAQAEGIRRFAHEDLRDPERNVLAGSWYLSKLVRRYEGTDNALPYALADYNAGRTHVLRWMRGSAKTNSTVFLAQMDFPGTQKYIQAVLERHAYYRAALDAAK